MGKNVFKTITVVLVVVLLVSLTVGVINFAKLNGGVDEGILVESDEKPLYHFMVIIDGTNTAYAEQFKKGMLSACSQMQAAVEFWNITGTDKMERILKQVDIGIESGVDGIIVYSYNNSHYKDALSKAARKDIPLVTVNQDVPESERVSHVGINGFYIGSEIGKLLNEKITGPGSVIVLQRDASEAALMADSETAEGPTGAVGDSNVVAVGIKDTLKDYGSLQIIQKNYSGNSILTAEEVAVNVLDNYDDIKAVICTNGQDTLGVVEVLIDANRISGIEVISYDVSPEILEYIDREVVTATVVADYEKVGYNSIQALVQYRQESIVEAYSYIDTQIIAKDNIDAYKEKTNEADEDEAD